MLSELQQRQVKNVHPRNDLEKESPGGRHQRDQQTVGGQDPEKSDDENKKEDNKKEKVNV